MLRRILIVECGIARFLCAVRVFEHHPLGYLYAKFCSLRGPIAELAHGENRVLTHLLIQLSLRNNHSLI